MYITWEDRKNRGKIDEIVLRNKPELSFQYAWMEVTQTTAQFVPTHEYGVWNQDMSEEQIAEVVAYYKSYVREPFELPAYDSETQKLVENGVDVINELTYRHYDVVDKTEEELSVDFEEAKQAKIRVLQEALNQEREEYLSQYPQWEIDTFEPRQKEVNAYDQDNTAPTPIIDAMVGGDPTLRIEMIDAVREKMLYLAQKTGQVVVVRDAIKACTTKEELEAIAWNS